jgi:hypothetical protein
MSDEIIIKLFCVTEAVLALMAMGIVVAQLVLHWSIPFQIPSVYWPIAKLGFSPQTDVRRVFRRLFSRWYRKRFWNPIMDAWRKVRGFDRQRHVASGSIHAVCSAMALAVLPLFLYFAHKAALSGQSEVQPVVYTLALGVTIFELAFNAPAIVLSRYLYLLTIRRPGLTSI